jgi:GNAT superfamily N-acetyltransferase
MLFTRRSLRGRPRLEVEITKVKYETWKLFAPFHYLTPELNHAAKCFGLFIEDRITSFVGILHRPHPKVRDIVGVSRVVTLPDWQGLGLAMVLLDNLGAAYRSIGKRLHNYPAHPAFIRTHQRSRNWTQVKEQGTFSPRRGQTSSVAGFGGRPCAVFCYVGQAMDQEQAKNLIEI